MSPGVFGFGLFFFVCFLGFFLFHLFLFCGVLGFSRERSETQLSTEHATLILLRSEGGTAVCNLT